MKLFFALCVTAALPCFAQIESDTENVQSHPHAEFTAYERREAAESAIPYQSGPIYRKRYGQGQPGFLAAPSHGNSEIETDSQDIESEPFEELEEFERREAAIENKGKISITADVRFRWTPQAKKTYGFQTRGSAAVNPVQVSGAKPTATLPVGTPIAAPTNFYQGETNLYLDFDGGKDWVETQIQFKNNLGIESGTSNGVSMRKAWIGYSFYEDCLTEIYLELGRKGLSSIFDSRIQFDNTFDGILFTYDREFKCVGNLKVYGGPFIVDYRTNHYAWVGEADFEDIAGTGFYTKYSWIKWKKQGVDRNGVKDSPNYRFINSQIMVGYDFCPDIVGCNTGIYGAYLINHAAKRVTSSNFGKHNQAWYVAAEIGKLGKQGDWLFDVCYQDVGYQAVPNIDMSGIGRGNSTGRGDTAAVANPWDPSLFTVPSDVNLVPAAQAEGNTNYRGVEVRTYYGVTDRITLKATSDYSWQKFVTIGGTNKFLKFDLQIIYDF